MPSFTHSISLYRGKNDIIYQEFTTGKVLYVRSNKSVEYFLPLTSCEWISLSTQGYNKYDPIYLCDGNVILEYEDLAKTVSRRELVSSFKDLIHIDRELAVHASISSRARNILCCIMDEHEYASYTGN